MGRVGWGGAFPVPSPVSPPSGVSCVAAEAVPARLQTCRGTPPTPDNQPPAAWWWRPLPSSADSYSGTWWISSCSNPWDLQDRYRPIIWHTAIKLTHCVRLPYYSTQYKRQFLLYLTCTHTWNGKTVRNSIDKTKHSSQVGRLATLRASHGFLG